MWAKIKSLLFENKTAKQTTAKNTFWLSVSNFGGRLLRAIIIIYAARVLGAAGWGVFSYAVSLVAIITLFTDIGINSILQRDASKTTDPEFRIRTISTSFILKFTLVALGVAAILLITPHVATVQGVSGIMPIVVFIFIFDSLQSFGFSIIRAKEKMEWEAAAYLAANAAIVIFGFVFLYIATTVRSFALAYAVGDGVGTLAAILVVRSDAKKFLSYFSWKRLKTILASAWPFAISAALGMLMLNTDVLIIGWMRSAADVGLYSAAQRIINLLYVLPSLMSISLLPTFARLANKDNPKFRTALELALGLNYLVAVPVAVCGFIVGQNLISLIFGTAYSGAGPVFQILALTMAIDFPVSILSGAVFAFDQQKKLTVYSAIGGVSNVLFDLLLIPTLGIIGSAIATFCAQLLSNIYLWHAAKKVNYFRVLPHLKKVIMATTAAAATCVILMALSIHIIVVIMAAIAVYFMALFLFKEPLLGEAKIIWRSAS